ncbi:MAG: hypothetical protein P8173_17490 [Gammaproteobacteria bacterium]
MHDVTVPTFLRDYAGLNRGRNTDTCVKVPETREYLRNKYSANDVIQAKLNSLVVINKWIPISVQDHIELNGYCKQVVQAHRKGQSLDGIDLPSKARKTGATRANMREECKDILDEHRVLLGYFSVQENQQNVVELLNKMDLVDWSDLNEGPLP